MSAFVLTAATVFQYKLWMELYPRPEQARHYQFHNALYGACAVAAPYCQVQRHLAFWLEMLISETQINVHFHATAVPCLRLFNQ